jgi:hypothetical protein
MFFPRAALEARPGQAQLEPELEPNCAQSCRCRMWRIEAATRPRALPRAHGPLARLRGRRCGQGACQALAGGACERRSATVPVAVAVPVATHWQAGSQHEELRLPWQLTSHRAGPGDEPGPSKAAVLGSGQYDISSSRYY